MTKKILFFSLVFIILFGSAELVFSQPRVGRDLEIEYPEVAGGQPEKVTFPVPEYVRYIYNGLIWLSGLIALIVLIIGGFEWFTSAGNIDRIRSAKDRISAALLGLVILIGSYLILISINPELVVFHLPRLRPIISELTPGVLVCKKPVEVDQAFDITINYPYYHDEKIEVQKAKELDQILEVINDNCYTVAGQGDIRSDFDNKITDIYFIPGVEKGYGVNYGAIIYEETGYNGKSQVFYEHMNWVGSPKHYGSNDLNIKLSSIKPLVIGWQPDPNWQVVLYQETDFNKDVPWLGQELFLLHKVPCGANDLWCDVNLRTFFSWSPKSIKIEGNLLAVLFTKDGKSETFSENDYNLDDNLNIVKQVACTDYKNQTIIKKDCIPTGGFGSVMTYMPCCGEAAATRMMIISASIY